MTASQPSPRALLTAARCRGSLGASGEETKLAAQIAPHVNMYRVTGDDWDSWAAVDSHFAVAHHFASAGLIGAAGLQGVSWPDLDMLPFGYITSPNSGRLPYKNTSLTQDEQRSQMTLWSIARSPLSAPAPRTPLFAHHAPHCSDAPHLIAPAPRNCAATSPGAPPMPPSSPIAAVFGGDATRLDAFTTALLGNPRVLAINEASSHNRQVLAPWRNSRIDRTLLRVARRVPLTPPPFPPPTQVHADNTSVVWAADGANGEVYAALFNTGQSQARVAVALNALGLPADQTCACVDQWGGETLPDVRESLSLAVKPHGVALVTLSGCARTERALKGQSVR